MSPRSTHRSEGNYLVVRVDLLATDLGGLAHPISSGYRPLCVVTRPDGSVIVAGLCELQLDAELAPGASASGKLVFDDEVFSELRRNIGPGSAFALAEGQRRIATAVVESVSG